MSTVTVDASGGTPGYTGTGTFSHAAGTYSYTVTDHNGCTAETTGTITEPSAVTASSSNTAIACNGGMSTVTVSASGGTPAYTGTGAFSHAAGTYSYTVTDHNGCTATTTGNITQPSAVTLSLQVAGCSTGSNGSITATFAGGTGPYQVKIDGGSFTTQSSPYTFTGLAAGSHTVTVKDANGCTTSDSITVPACASPTPSPTPTATPGCAWSPPPSSGIPSLGCAAQFTVFAMNSPNATQTANFSNTIVTGDVAASSGVTLKHAAPSIINGNLYLAPGATFQPGGQVNGTIFTNQSQLAQCRQDAINASAQAAALPPNYTFAKITTNTTITGVSGLNVVNITGDINMGSSNSLTLSGPADAFFVVNVGGQIKFTGSGGIFAGGSMPRSHLLINMTVSGSKLSTGVGNTIQGTLLGPKVGGSLDGFYDNVILGQNFSLLSGVTVGCPR
jgi:choice-of-anchor A domain-containing protein